MTEDLERYRILSSVGAGGMGEVFLAEDSRLSRKVALKLLPVSFCSDPGRRSRFLQEARTAARLNHPNICTIFDSGEVAGGQVFIAMEYIEGQTLAERLRGGPMEIDELLDISMQVAEALDEAHGKGIVHRDLKPGNLMLTSKGMVKVVDFGLAKITLDVGSGEGDDQSPTNLRTQSGMIVGTIPYVSPEQALGQEIDSRSDIFSFGVVLYQLASGKLPFPGRSSVETLQAILNSEPPALEAGRMPLEMERIIRKSLEKERENRYQSVRELLVDLRNLKRAIDPSSAKPAPVEVEKAPQNNLPTQITSFIGREIELGELRQILASTRLLTITGAGGSGKTRLAVEVARGAAAGFPGGAWFVNLAPVSSPELVLKGIADALRLKEEPGQDFLSAIVSSLASRTALLILDNCEQVIEEVARIADALVRSVPGLTIVATSRESLGIAGEHTWSAPPLAVPDARRTVLRDSALTYDAVRLFVERATATQAHFTLTNANAGVIVDICRQLDGIPLAIELAAARIRAMSADEIHRRLNDCFRLLTGGARVVLPRHQTLRAAVDWSFELLTSSERTLFQRLSVFSAGFDLGAAEEVCGFDEVEHDEVLDQLSRLVDKSLVVSEHHPDGGARYRLLEPLRQYAAEKLPENGSAAVMARRHFDHYATLADRAYDERIEKGPLWLDILEREHDNLRAALSWSDKNDQAGELRLAGALSWFWQLHCHFSEGRSWLRSILARPCDRNRNLARALWGASTLAIFQGDFMEGRAGAEESLAIWRELGDFREVALALESLGWSSWFADRNQEALQCFEECLHIHTEHRDERLINRTNLAICQVLVSDFDVEKAEPIAAAALPIAIRHEEPRDIHNAHHYLADCLLIRGEVAAAEQTYKESLRAAARYGDRLEMSWEVEGIAMSLAGQQRDRKALKLLGAVMQERKAMNVNASVRFWDELRRRYIGAAEQRLGNSAALALEEGRSMTFDAAIDYALDAGRDEAP